MAFFFFFLGHVTYVPLLLDEFCPEIPVMTLGFSTTMASSHRGPRRAPFNYEMPTMKSSFAHLGFDVNGPMVFAVSPRFHEIFLYEYECKHMQLSYLSYLSIMCVLADGYCIVGMVDIFILCSFSFRCNPIITLYILLILLT